MKDAKVVTLGLEAINRNYRMDEGATIILDSGKQVELTVRYLTKGNKPFLGLQIADSNGFEEYQHLRFPMRGFSQVYEGIEARLTLNASNKQIACAIRSVNGSATLQDNYR